VTTSDSAEVRDQLKAGLSVADVVLPLTKPSALGTQPVRMNPIPVNLAIEDELSETVLHRIIAHTGRGYAIGTAYGRGGFGYLKRTIHGWNRPPREFLSFFSRILTNSNARWR